MSELSSKERNALPDSQFGLPEERKFPLNDPTHVSNAAARIEHAPESEQKTLAKKILAKAHKYGMDTSDWDKTKQIAQEEVDTLTDPAPKNQTTNVNSVGGFTETDLERQVYLNSIDTANSFRPVTSSVETADEQITVNDANRIAALIRAQVLRDSKPPTGNQNCQLCTWCAEAQFRGINVLPRPIYSPRDPALEIVGEGIVKNPQQNSIRDKNDVINQVTNAGDGARFYCHVKWNGGAGGHEFLLLNLEGSVYLMDAQQGFVSMINGTGSKSYFDNINYQNSYIARLDDHELNEELLREYNDPSKTIMWDPARDIPYMKENGLLSSLETEYTMRNATISDLEFVYQSELETVGENKDDPKVQKYIRDDARDSIGHTKIIVVNGEDVGVYQAYATDYYGLRGGDEDWWYLAHIYIKPEYRSFGIGSAIIKKDISEHDKILLQVMKSNTRAKKLYESLGFVVDQENNHGGIVMRIDKTKAAPKPDHVQEYTSGAALMTVQNQLRNILGNSYTFMGSGTIPKFNVKSNAKPSISFDITVVNGTNAECTPLVNGIPDMLHKKRGIALMRAASVLADFIKTFVASNSDGSVQESFISDYMPKHKWSNLSSVKTNHIKKWPHKEHGDEDGWEVDQECDDTFTTRLDVLVYVYLYKCFKYWAVIPKANWDISKLAEFDINPFKVVDGDDDGAAWLVSEILEFLLREIIAAVSAVIWVVEDFDLLPEDRQTIHEGFSKFDHKEFIEIMTDVGNLAEHLLDSSILRIRDHNQELTPDEHKQLDYIHFVGDLYIADVYYWVTNSDYEKERLKEAHLRDLKRYDRRDQPRNSVQESANIIESGHFDKYKDDVLGFNDEGMAVMKKCECGGKISIAMKGEPIYTCESCGKTYGCVPFQEGFTGKNSYSDEINQLIGRIERYEKILRNETNAENKDKIRIHLVGLYMNLIQKVDYAAHDTHIDDTELNELCDLGNDTAKKYVQMVPDIKNPTYGMITYQYAIVAQVDWAELRKFINKPGKYSDFLTEWLYLRAIGSSKEPTNDKLPTFKGCKEIAQFIKGEITYEAASRKCDEYVTEAILSIVNDILRKKSKPVQEGAFQDLKNGVNPYSDDMVFHVSMDKHIDGQVWQPRVPDYLDPYNPEDTGFEDNTTPRICFSTSIEGALNGITVNLQRQSPDTFDKMYVYVPEKPWKEYKHKTNKQLVKDKLVYDANVTREVWIMEPVRMKLYGVIRVDQIADAKRKSVVPTSKGQKDTRNYFTYKWHWIVKPKVLKKATKFDYSVETVLSNLCIDVKKFKYGLIKDGRLMTGNVSDADYDKYWVFHSGEMVDQAGGGNCYDMVEYEAGYLEAFGVAYKKYFINATNLKNKTLGTHTICVVPHNGKFIYIEQAFKRVVDEWGYERKKEFDKLNDVFDYVAECMADYDGQPIDFGVWDYTTADIDYGTPIKNFQEWIMTKCKMIYDGEVKNPTVKKEDK